MNEQLVGWFEDLLPEIKKSGDVEGVFLKFANDKNLAPALLEKLGHVYNTAKTVNYLDKSASHSKMRGDSFQILDVTELLEKYASEGKPDDHEYESNDFDSGRFTDLSPMPKKKGVDFESLLEAPDYEEIKMASDRSKEVLKESVKDRNVEGIDQLTFELEESNKKIAGEIISELRSPYSEFEFKDLEQDAVHYLGDSVKEACDFVADQFESLGYSFDRSQESSKSIIENTSHIVKFASIQDNLNTLEQAKDVKKNSLVQEEEEKSVQTDLFKQSSSGTKNKSKSKKSGPGIRGSDRSRTTGPLEVLEEIGADAQEDPISSAFKGYSAVGSGAASGAGALRDVGLNAVGYKPGTTLPEALAYARDNLMDRPLKALTGGRATKQEKIDSEMEETHYETMLQDLIITDPILAEEDEDRIVNAFNTIKSVAPEMSKDKNVMRMALRQAVQHEGIDPFTLQQYMEAEKELQKVRHNTLLERDISYTPTGRDRKLAN